MKVLSGIVDVVCCVIVAGVAMGFVATVVFLLSLIEREAWISLLIWLACTLAVIIVGFSFKRVETMLKGRP